MSKSNAARPTARRSSKSAVADQPPTIAERIESIKELRKHGGAHLVRPVNGLIQDTPSETIDRCRAVIRWVALVEQTCIDSELEAAEADVLLLVSDALEYAAKIVREVGSLSDVEVARA